MLVSLCQWIPAWFGWVWGLSCREGSLRARFARCSNTSITKSHNVNASENTPLRCERFWVPCLFSSVNVALRSMLGASFLTLQLSASVPWRSGCVQVQRMALLVPLECLASSWRSEQWRRILQLRREEYREFSSSASSLYSGFIHSPWLLCFVLSTFEHGRPHCWPNRLWSRD